MKKFYDEKILGFYYIEKSEIVNLQFDRFIKFIKDLEQGDDFGYDSLVLSVSGYDDTLEELYEINHVRRWFRRLICKLPHLFYFIHDLRGSRGTFLACLGEVESFLVGKRELPLEYLKEGETPSKLQPMMYGLGYLKIFRR
jgi:hypothetical protein